MQNSSIKFFVFSQVLLLTEFFFMTAQESEGRLLF